MYPLINFSSIFIALHNRSIELRTFIGGSSPIKMAVAIIVLGKENSPKYLSCLNTDKELQFRYKMHTALDFIEEKLMSAGKPSNDIRELYLGQLYAAEDYKLYGYVTNTKIKFIIAVDPANMLRDNDIRSMFRTLHTAYADAVCCPFYVPGSNIKSQKFDKIVKSLMEEVV